MGLQSEWMLQCYLWHNILSQREKQNKEVKNAVPQWPSLRQSARSSSYPGLFFFFFFFTLSRHVCSAMRPTFFFLLFLHSSLCLLTSGEKCWVGFRIPLRMADSQSLFVFVAPARESGHGQCANSCWQTDETRTLIESESDKNGTHFRPWSQPVWLLAVAANFRRNLVTVIFGKNIWCWLFSLVRSMFRVN